MPKFFKSILLSAAFTVITFWSYQSVAQNNSGAQRPTQKHNQAQGRTVGPTKTAEAAKAQSVSIMTLKQAIERALTASPTYLTAKNQWEAAHLESKNAFASFFPSLDLSASHGVQGINPDTAGVTTITPWVSSASLSLTENFYDNGESAKRYRIAGYKNELAKMNFEKSKAQVLRSVVLAYYNYLIAGQQLGFTQKSFNELERLSKLVSNQYYQGLKTRKDFLSFKTRAQRSRLDVIQAEKNQQRAEDELRAAVGVSPSEQVSFDQSAKMILPKKNLHTNFEADQLYEMRSLDLNRQIGEIEVDLAKRKFWPEINLVGAATYASSNYVDTNQTWADNNYTQWSVLLNLKWNLLDWGTRSRNIQIASVNQNTVQQSARISLLQAERELEQFKLDVINAAEDYRLSKELQKMEEDTFSLLERDYRAGRSSYLELVTGLANLLDAQARGQQADYRQADIYLRWKYYTGTLNEENIFE